MSLTAVGRAPATARYPLPARTAPAAWSGTDAPPAALVRIIQPVQGSAPFLAQHLAQEVMGEAGPHLPRWRERAAAYAAAPRAATYDLIA